VRRIPASTTAQTMKATHTHTRAKATSASAPTSPPTEKAAPVSQFGRGLEAAGVKRFPEPGH
jgi:hypothetical protein